VAWQLDGTYFENCNCDVVCPCSASSLALPADNDRCQVLFAFHVDRGEIDGVDVGDRTVVLVADTPKQMTDGNWRVGVILDDAASEEQGNALASVFGGERGGIPATLTPLIGEMLGLERAPIDFADDGFTHRLKVGEDIELEVEDIVPEGEFEPTKLVGVHLPANSTVTVARATRSKIRTFGMEFHNEGKNGHAAPFSWSG
jgi:hypothetical protein